MEQLFCKKESGKRDKYYFVIEEKDNLFCYNCRKKIEPGDVINIWTTASKREYKKLLWCPVCASLIKKNPPYKINPFNEVITAVITNFIPDGTVKIVPTFPPSLTTAKKFDELIGLIDSGYSTFEPEEIKSVETKDMARRSKRFPLIEGAKIGKLSVDKDVELDRKFVTKEGVEDFLTLLKKAIPVLSSDRTRDQDYKKLLKKKFTHDGDFQWIKNKKNLSEDTRRLWNVKV